MFFIYLISTLFCISNDISIDGTESEKSFKIKIIDNDCSDSITNETTIKNNFINGTHEHLIKDYSYTAMPIAVTGSGKSLLGCKFIEIDDAFEYGDSSQSITNITIAKGNVINGNQFYYIDNTGFFTTDGKDKIFIKDMIEYLRKWEKGINCFFITINSQINRFDTNIQMMLKLIHYFFNNPQLWKQTAFVFTKSFIGKFNRDLIITEYKKKVIDLIKTFPGCEKLDLDFECFFVDSDTYDTDDNTRNEFNRMRNYAKKFKPVQTMNLRAVNPKYMMKEKKIMKKQFIKKENETLDNSGKIKQIFYYVDLSQTEILDWNGKLVKKQPKIIRNWTEWQIEEYEFLPDQSVKIEFQGKGKGEVKIEHFENQKRLKILYENGTIEFGPIEKINSRINVTKATVRYEYKTKLVKENRESYYKNGKRLPTWERVVVAIPTLGISEFFMDKEEYDYTIIRKTYQYLQREIITSPNGYESTGEWVILKEYKNEERIY